MRCLDSRLSCSAQRHEKPVLDEEHFPYWASRRAVIYRVSLHCLTSHRDSMLNLMCSHLRVRILHSGRTNQGQVSKCRSEHGTQKRLIAPSTAIEHNLSDVTVPRCLVYSSGSHGASRPPFRTVDSDSATNIRSRELHACRLHQMTTCRLSWWLMTLRDDASR